MSAPLNWRPFGRAAFDEARAGRKPVLLVLDGAARWESGALAAWAARYSVPVLAELLERPDVHARYRAPCGVCLLADDGDVLGAPERDDTDEALLAALTALREAQRPDVKKPAGQDGPAWAGAVGAAQNAALDPELPRRAVEEAKAAPEAALAAVEILLHAAGEWGDEAAGTAAREKLDRFLARHWDEGALKLAAPVELPASVYFTRLFADAAAALGGERYAEVAAKLGQNLLKERRDASLGAFPHRPGGRVYGDLNARAVVALLRAAPFGRSRELVAAAEDALLYLERSLYDPLLGMLHRRSDDGAPLVYNLLGDNAEAALAFTEAYLRTGRKPYRDFADALIKHMFQELWDRDRGGFLDRAAAEHDPLVMRRSSAPGALNAVAFEALWRLHETKGNANYRRWLEWGLKALAPDAAGAQAAALARVQDMFARGRMDLELVGRVGEAATDALLEEIHRHYAPRRIVSFVDPDDQDYILAHKLARKGEPQVFPRVFGCVELRPVAEAGAPPEVAAVIAALRKGK